jgi:hypothetical protein
MAGEVLMAKRLRMTLDFEVEVEEVTDESLHEHYRKSANYEELVGDSEWWENARRQGRLQRALLEDEEALRKYLTYVAAVEVDPSSDSRLCEVFGVNVERAEEDILGAVFGRLGTEDARYYREVSAEDNGLFDSVEVLSSAIRVRLTGARIEEGMEGEREEWRELAVGNVFG